MKRLEARRILVTGASAGIGEATARALAAEGAHVILAARRKEKLATLAAELSGSVAVALDVRDAAACERALGALELDGAILNAGLGRGLGSIADGSVAEWNEMLDTNVKGVLHVLHAVLPKLVGRGRGDLILLGSVAGRQVYPGGNVYCASKFAVRALYEALRVDLAGKNVRVTTVDPGMVLTDFSITRFHGDRERAAKVYQGMTPLAPSDVADAIVFALTRPPHVNIGEIVLWPTDQASTTQVTRRG